MSLRADPLVPGPRTIGLRVVDAAAAAVGQPAGHGRPWRRSAHRYVAITVTADLLAAFTITAAASQARYGWTDALLLGLLAALTFVLATAACRGYRPRHVVVGTAELRSMLYVTGALAVVSLTIEGVGLVQLPHWLVFQALLLTVGMATLTRIVQRTITRRMRADGRLARRTLLVGPPQSLGTVFDALDEGSAHGLTVVGICTPEAFTHDAPSPVVGTYDAVSEVVAELGVETVVVSADAMGHTELRRLGWSLRALPAELLVVPPLGDLTSYRLHLELMAGTPLLSVSFSGSRLQRWMKTVVDRTVGSLLLLLASPVILTGGLAIRLTSRGPAFFAQTRVGIDGRPFTMHKLRSMFEDAEERLAELEALNDGNGMLFKMHEDPRVTPIGRVLRRLSVDELPQLWNVVKGDMSLVGPRPALPHEVAAYDGDVVHRLRVKPGLTGLWQVSGRSNLSTERSVRLDLRYTDNWTVGMDARILLRTARAVVHGDGAY